MMIDDDDEKGHIQKAIYVNFVSWDTKPPFVSYFAREKILHPIFFLENESIIAKTNFTLGPIKKSLCFVLL